MLYDARTPKEIPMTIAEFCLPAAVLLALLPIGWAKAIGRRSFDNARPREASFYASGIRARLHGAHLNGIEAFPFFAAAVIVAEFRGAGQEWIDALAVAFVLCRLLYICAYAADRATLRSVLWAAGLAVNAAIFFLPLRG